MPADPLVADDRIFDDELGISGRAGVKDAFLLEILDHAVLGRDGGCGLDVDSVGLKRSDGGDFQTPQDHDPSRNVDLNEIAGEASNVVIGCRNRSTAVDDD
jgi:hypothetical protein